MDSQGLVQIGLYGTRFVLQVGGSELFIVKRVDLQRQHMRLQRWPLEYTSACDFKAFDKPWFKPEDFGIIARNGCLAKIRATGTRESVIQRFTDELYTVTPHATLEGVPLLTEAFGRPAYIVGAHSYILTGDRYQPAASTIKRNYPLTLEKISLSKYGYIIHPSIPELILLLEKHAGVLCDPFALQAGKKGAKQAQFVHVPII